MDVDSIACGDALLLMKTLEPESVDLVFADPPYWMRVEGVLNRVEGTAFSGCDDEWDNQFETTGDYNGFTVQWLRECKRVLKPNGCIWVIGGMQCIYSIGAIMQELGFWFINDVIWHKRNPTPNFLGTRLNNAHETLIFATKSQHARYTFHYKTARELNVEQLDPQAYRNGERRQLGSVWRLGVCRGNERAKDTAGNKLHSTQKPEALLYRLLAISSNAGDLVLDPFGGTFTTAAVAKRMGRRYISFDKNEEYVRYGQQRVDAVTPIVGDIERAVYDKKPPRIAITQLLHEGYLKSGEELCFKNNKAKAILREDGRVLFREEILDIHNAAARALETGARRLNGYTHWYVQRSGAPVSLGEVRSQYMLEMLGIQKNPKTWGFSGRE